MVWLQNTVILHSPPTANWKIPKNSTCDSTIFKFMETDFFTACFIIPIQRDYPILQSPKGHFKKNFNICF